MRYKFHQTLGFLLKIDKFIRPPLYLSSRFLNNIDWSCKIYDPVFFLIVRKKPINIKVSSILLMLKINKSDHLWFLLELLTLNQQDLVSSLMYKKSPCSPLTRVNSWILLLVIILFIWNLQDWFYQQFPCMKPHSYHRIRILGIN